MSQQPGDLMTPAEVAAMCRCSLASVYRWVIAGKLPACRTPGGGGIRILRQDAEMAMSPASRQAMPRHRSGRAARAAQQRRTREILAAHGLDDGSQPT